MVSLVDATSVSESIMYRTSPVYQRSIAHMGNDIPRFPQGHAELIAYLLRVDSDAYILCSFFRLARAHQVLLSSCGPAFHRLASCWHWRRPMALAIMFLHACVYAQPGVFGFYLKCACRSGSCRCVWHTNLFLIGIFMLFSFMVVRLVY